jgi:hypothetical protein
LIILIIEGTLLDWPDIISKLQQLSYFITGFYDNKNRLFQFILIIQLEKSGGHQFIFILLSTMYLITR